MKMEYWNDGMLGRRITEERTPAFHYSRISFFQKRRWSGSVYGEDL
jgi:hypothetical protein